MRLNVTRLSPGQPFDATLVGTLQADECDFCVDGERGYHIKLSYHGRQCGLLYDCRAMLKELVQICCMGLM